MLAVERIKSAKHRHKKRAPSCQDGVCFNNKIETAKLPVYSIEASNELKKAFIQDKITENEKPKNDANLFCDDQPP